ncbi:TSUP family transporter [Clostridium lundense]|uniref:TSUP family transporter n=1 Tax=Clostridium lundense TaxID=319475 RepID=UPI00055853FE|nr:TSUP family transporter [Clostridium lundense]
MLTFLISNQSLLVLYFLVFVAGVIDSAAGGGGLIALPAYMVSGMPVHVAFASNKFSSACGTTFSTLRFLKHRSIDIYIALAASVSSFIGSAIASKIVLLLDAKILNKMLVIIIPIAAIAILFNKNYSDENISRKSRGIKDYIIAVLIGLLIGFYDGLIGPGSGTFAIIIFSVLMKYDLRTASGNAKLLNLASNYASLITFIFAGTIRYSVAIPAAFCCILGNYIGAGLAIKKGSKFIRPMMIVVLALLLIKMLSNVLGW